MAGRPHIIVFMTDDHGRWASGPYGDPVIQTPSLNHLAATGAVMERAFTPTPVCSPARACFWTGAIASRHGIHDYLAEHQDLKHPALKGQTTLAMRLNQAGYHTGLCGKWHCHHFDRAPRGFDFWFSNAAGTNATFGPQPFYQTDGSRVEHHGHQSVFTTDRAIDFLRQRPQDQPFFLFVGYTNTHTPHTGEPQRLVSRYRQADFGHIPRETLAACHGRADVDVRDGCDPESRAQYAAAVHHIDEQVGRILDELDNQGLRDHTLMVYTSDHGHMNGHHGLHRKGNATVPQNLIDDSVLVPCLLSWPDVIQPQQRYSQMVDHCDLFAALLDAAGLDTAAQTADAHSPGRSYLPLLQGQSLPSWRDAQFCEYGNARMIRTDEHKLIRRWPGFNGHFPDEFYDLTIDPRERCNRLGDPAYAAIIQQLDQRLARYYAAWEDPARSGTRIMEQPVCNPRQCWGQPPGA